MQDIDWRNYREAHIPGKPYNPYKARRELAEKDPERYRKAVEIVTDETRRQAGLSPRGPDGLTLEELYEMERARMEVLKSLPQTPVAWVTKPGVNSDE